MLMKKIFTLLAALVMTMGAFATDYTDQLVVTVNGVSSTQKATISLSQNENGTYDFSLKNFILESEGQQMAVGTIALANCEGTTANGVTSLSVDRTVNISNGNQAGVDMWLGPMLGPVPVRMVAEQRDSSLYAVIDIDMKSTLGQVIKVTFGGGYQIKNSGFEDFHNEVLHNQAYDDNYNVIGWAADTAKIAQVPNAWHSFMSASGYTTLEDGSYANSPTIVYLASGLIDPHTYVSNDVRPGSTGTHSAKVVARNAFIAIANGTITTGRMNTGSTTAADVANHAWLDMDSTGVDLNGDPFYTVMNGRPDSLAVWVKYNQGTANAEHPYATISAAITDGTYYQDPQDKEYTNVLATAKNNTIEATGNDWKRIVVPFSYVDRNVNGKALLATISTNADAGQGSEGDSILVDDISLIYNPANATAISFKGDAVNLAAGNTQTLAKSYANLAVDDIVVTTDNDNAKVFKTLEQSDDNVVATIKVASNDLQNINTYTFTIPNSTTGVRAINVEDAKADAAPAEIYNINGQRVNNTQPGQVYIIKQGGKTFKVLK